MLRPGTTAEPPAISCPLRKGFLMEEVPFSTLLLTESSTLVVVGCVDELNVTAFRDALREATADDTVPAVVDLNGVTFMPSMAINVLVEAMNHAAGIRVQVAKDRPAHRVLKLVGLYDYMTTGHKAPDMAL